jgi:hypothetical protein
MVETTGRRKSEGRIQEQVERHFNVGGGKV